MDELLDRYFAVAFPVFFALIWLTVTTLNWALSGWWRLQAAYPVRQVEAARVILRNQSGMMGLFVSMRGILGLAATETGLKVRIWPLFGPFSRPFLVPWREVNSERAQMLFGPMTKLTFGSPVIGRLWIDTTAWERLAPAADARLAPTLSNRITRSELIQGLFTQWLIFTAFASAFFYFAPLLVSGAPQIPLAVAFGFPALVFGLPLTIRYFAQARTLKD